MDSHAALERFLVRTTIDSAGCWLMDGHPAHGGYGQFHADGRNNKGHRWAYEFFVGPVPDGMELDHLCRQPRCCNPAHLEPVTHLVNMQRAASRNGALLECPAGHPYDAQNTYLYGGRRYCRACHNARSINRERDRRHGIPAKPSGRPRMSCRR